MILPIYAYGHPILKRKAEDISSGHTDLAVILANMWETMYAAQGVGLAAPQVGLSVRIFIVDTVQILEEEKKPEGIRKVFINARVTDESGDLWPYEEGCLSIPHIRGDVERKQKVRIRYHDENFELREEIYEGINARVIQHEYDHIEGILFVEKLKPLKKKLIQRKLNDIKTGKITADYKLKYLKL